MRSLNQPQRIALEAVARHLSGTILKSGAGLRLAGKAVPVSVQRLKARAATSERPGLRFDRVVQWLIRHLRSTLEPAIPAGTALLVTVTAPIRLPSRTAGVIEEHALALLRSTRRTSHQTVHGNEIQIRVLRDLPKQCPKLIAFVHNPGTDPQLLFEITREFIGFFGSKKRAGEWLVVVSALPHSFLVAYRAIFAQLCDLSPLKNALVVFPDLRVDSLNS